MRLLALLLAILSMAAPASAFCGFYVARADGDLFNEASKVIVARYGGRSTITMSADYQGEPSEFAMVVPTPIVLDRKLVKTVPAEVMNAVDAYTAPRLVEYLDDDPCNPVVMMEAVMAAPRSAVAERERGPSAFGVTIEDQYAVGSYDIVILSAKESGGLVEYLLAEGYNIPEGAKPYLAEYIAKDMKFFVARVNLERHAAGETAVLEPLQLWLPGTKFMLPIRLGMANAKGPQDLILMTLSKEGRVTVDNYDVHRLPSNENVPLFVEERFAEFYRALFKTAIDEIGGTGIMLEYAWDMAWCDPCAADPPTNDQLRSLGVSWIEDQPNGGQDVFVTRLHARYDTSFAEDFVLRETRDRENFQGRYVMQKPFTGPMQCEAAEEYVQLVKDRTRTEAERLADLTGWSPKRIDEEIAKTLPERFR